MATVILMTEMACACILMHYKLDYMDACSCRYYEKHLTDNHQYSNWNADDSVGQHVKTNGTAVWIKVRTRVLRVKDGEKL